LVPIVSGRKESLRTVDRYFCFRFDVDTHRCIRRGVPNLVDLGDRMDAPFTFFVNMGRAVSRARLLSRGTADVAAKLPGRAKLGARDALVAAILNPYVGAGSPGVVNVAIDAGHEVGLHGGANHADWQADAHLWAPRRVREEVAAGLRVMEEATGHRPQGFASPGWNAPDSLPGILEELGFRYVADRHGPEAGEGKEGKGDVRVAPETERLADIRTAITAEPGGVAYLENLRARGVGDEDIRTDFRERLQYAGRLAVVYDHPYFAGIRELDMVRDMVEMARDLGFRVVRLVDAVAALAGPPGSPNAAG
jgi:peptidoglycan/xylan/chitin deacetylase (PgdA/CDA1 family)